MIVSMLPTITVFDAVKMKSRFFGPHFFTSLCINDWSSSFAFQFYHFQFPLFQYFLMEIKTGFTFSILAFLNTASMKSWAKIFIDEPKLANIVNISQIRPDLSTNFFELNQRTSLFCATRSFKWSRWWILFTSVLKYLKPDHFIIGLWSLSGINS